MAHPTGAIPQRDGRTFAIATWIPGGIVPPDTLEKLAAVARKYEVPMVKLTSGQRIMLIGNNKEDLEPVYRDLGMIAEREITPCVKYVPTGLGTDVCPYGNQDSFSLGLELERKYHSMGFPAKLKFSVSGCPRCCGESHIRDIGIFGRNRGWAVVFGGNSGRRPALGRVIARDLSLGRRHSISSSGCWSITGPMPNRRGGQHGSWNGLDSSA